MQIKPEKKVNTHKLIKKTDQKQHKKRKRPLNNT